MGLKIGRYRKFCDLNICLKKQVHTPKYKRPFTTTALNFPEQRTTILQLRMIVIIAGTTFPFRFYKLNVKYDEQYIFLINKEI